MTLATVESSGFGAPLNMEEARAGLVVSMAEEKMRRLAEKRDHKKYSSLLNGVNDVRFAQQMGRPTLSVLIDALEKICLQTNV